MAMNYMITIEIQGSFRAMGLVHRCEILSARLAFHQRFSALFPGAALGPG